MDVEEVLQPVAAVGQGDPLLGIIHAHLPGLTTHLQPQLLQIVKAREVTNAIAWFGQRLVVALPRLRIVDHGHRHHATVYLRRPFALPQNPR